MNKNTASALVANDCVIVRLDNGTEQSAVLTHYSTGTSLAHTFAHFAWKTGPGKNDVGRFICHSTRLKERILATFPAGHFKLPRATYSPLVRTIKLDNRVHLKYIIP